MNQQLKQRIVGAIVLISMAVIFVPALLDGRHKNVSPLIEREIPQKPSFIFEEIKLPAKVDPGAAPSRIIESQKDVSVKPPQPQVATPKSVQKAAKSPPGPAGKSATVATESAEAPAAWVVQIASLTNSTRAFELRDKLKKAGFVAFVEEITSEGQKFYRIRVGPELKEAEAISLQQQLKQKMEMDGRVMRYHPL